MNQEEKCLKVFAERMRKLRLQKGKKENRDLTQVAVSEEIGLHVNTIRAYESKALSQLPKIERLIKIKNYYDTTYEYLLGEDDYEKNSNYIENLCEETNLSEDSIKFLIGLNKDDEFIFLLNKLIEAKKDFQKENNH